MFVESDKKYMYKKLKCKNRNNWPEASTLTDLISAVSYNLVTILHKNFKIPACDHNSNQNNVN